MYIASLLIFKQSSQPLPGGGSAASNAPQGQPFGGPAYQPFGGFPGYGPGLGQFQPMGSGMPTQQHQHGQTQHTSGKVMFAVMFS